MGKEGQGPAHQTGRPEDSANRTAEEEPARKTPPAGGKAEGAEAPTTAWVLEATRSYGESEYNEAWRTTGCCAYLGDSQPPTLTEKPTNLTMERFSA